MAFGDLTGIPSYKLDSQNSGSNKAEKIKNFLEYLKGEGIISAEQAKELSTLSPNSIIETYKEEYNKFQQTQSSDTQASLMSPKEDSVNTIANDVTLDDATNAIDEELMAQEEESLTLDDIEKEMETSKTSWVDKKNATKNISVNDIDNYNNKTKLLRDMYKDEDVMAIVDEDGDGKISDEEKQKFESYIQGDKDELELDDVKDSLKKIKNQEFLTGEYKNYKVPDPKLKLDDIDNADALSRLQGANGANGAGSGGGGGVGSAGSGGGNTKPIEKTIDNMTIDELKAEKTKAQGEMKTEQSKLSDLDKGNSEALKSQEEAKENAQKNYEDLAKEVDEELGEKLEDANNKVDEAQVALDEADTAVFNQEQVVAEATAQKTQIANYKTEMDNKVASCQSSYDSAAATLASTPETIEVEVTEGEPPNQTTRKETQPNPAYEPAKQAEAVAKAQLETAQEMAAQAAEQLTQAEQNLQKATEDKTALEQARTEKQTVLEQANQEKTDVEKQLAQKDEDGKLVEAKEACEKAEKAFDDKKQELRTTQKEAVKAKQDYINKIDSKIQTRESKANENSTFRQKCKENGVNPVLSSGLNMKSQWHGAKDGVPPYLHICPDGLDPNEEAPVMVILHDSDRFLKEGATEHEGSIESMPIVHALVNGQEVTMTGEELSQWNGHIIVPQTHHSWEGDAATNAAKMNEVTAALDDLSRNYNIDADNIAMVGLSAGGAGALMFGDLYNDYQSKYKLSSVTTFGTTSAYTDLSGIDIPVHLIYGTGDNSVATNKYSDGHQSNVSTYQLPNQRWHYDGEALIADYNNWIQLIANDLFHF